MPFSMILDSIEGLPEPVAKEYVKGEDGKFHLQIEGYEDPGALKRAKDYEKEGRKNAEKQLKEAAEKVNLLQEEIDNIRRGAIPKGDVEKLENSWKEKLNKKEADLNSQLTAAQTSLRTLLVDNVAQSIATKISNSPDLILPHVKARLTTEINEGQYITRVLDRDGKPSASSIEELQKEFVADKRFAPIIIGSKASGGGASGTGSNGSGASGYDPSKFDMGKATPKALAAHIKAKKEATSGG